MRGGKPCVVATATCGRVPAWISLSDMGVILDLVFLGLAGRLERCCPPQQIVDHALGLSRKLGEPLVHVAALEMRPKSRNGNVDGRSNRRDLNLDHGFFELLDAARAHGTAI